MCDAVADVLATLSATVGYLPLTVVLVFVFVVVRAQLHVAPKSPTAEGCAPWSVPPSVSSTVPVLGHLIYYVRAGPSYFNKLW
jgi:hypothetical protein